MVIRYKWTVKRMQTGYACVQSFCFLQLWFKPTTGHAGEAQITTISPGNLQDSPTDGPQKDSGIPK